MPKHHKKTKHRKSRNHTRTTPSNKHKNSLCEWIYKWQLWSYVKINCL